MRRFCNWFGDFGIDLLSIDPLRNDRITPDQIDELRPTHIIISPGPCTPREAGVSNEVIRRFATTTPVLGVCLGHQCIGHVFAGEVITPDSYRGTPGPLLGTLLGRFPVVMLRSLDSAGDG